MNSHDEIGKCLGKLTKEAAFLREPFSLEPHLSLIDDCFSAGTVEGILGRLESSDHPFAKQVLAGLNRMSPLALKITHRALTEGGDKSLAECLQMEYRLSQRFCADHDFPEGKLPYHCVIRLLILSSPLPFITDKHAPIEQNDKKSLTLSASVCLSGS